MRARVGFSIGFVIATASALWSTAHPAEPPLLIDAGAVVPTPPPGENPIALPDPNLLFAPCPLTPRNLPQAQKRTA